MDFTNEQRRRVDEARNAFHRATIDVLKDNGVDTDELDITEAGESIALEGRLDL